MLDELNVDKYDNVLFKTRVYELQSIGLYI